MTIPLEFVWAEGAMRPLDRFQKRAAGQYVEGEVYRLGVVEERSSNSHSHYFASVTEAWRNLPEGAAEQFQTADHLRKFALIKCGFFNVRTVALGSQAEAERVASFVKPLDEYAIVTVTGAVVSIYTAKSQSYRAMPKGEFQQSKQAVLDYLASMVGVSAKQLGDEAGRAA
jgi:hypothetical protein